MYRLVPSNGDDPTITPEGEAAAETLGRLVSMLQQKGILTEEEAKELVSGGVAELEEEFDEINE